MKKQSSLKGSSLAQVVLLCRKSLSWVLLLLLVSVTLMQGCKKIDVSPDKSSSQNSDNTAISGSYDLKLVADNFVSPLSVVDPSDGTKRLFVVDQIGKIWIIGPDGTTLPTPFLDISSKLVTLNPGYDERGLLSLAFHPNFKSNGKFYVFYTAPPRPGGPDSGVSWDNQTRISEFKVSSNPNRADMSSERIIFKANHPQGNHNGGSIAFGPDDGYLYISIGDGGFADDNAPGHVDDWYKKNAGGNGQDITHNLLGNVLRIDVNKTSADQNYGIPPDNPFVGHPGKDEIWAFGLRNPYRFSFDMGGQHWLYLGDAGQSLYEEIDVITKGGNYGWNVKEGTHCFNTDDDLKERKACPVEDPQGNRLIDPVIEAKNTANPEGGGLMVTIVGGNVYRGTALPLLYGKYIFGAYSATFDGPQGKLYIAKPSTIGLWSFKEFHPKSFPKDLGQWLKGFGQDRQGEIYVVASEQAGPQGNTGKIWKLVFAREGN
jgi:glucose/arabinose dehydrogenase